MPKFQTTLLFDLDGTLIDSTPAILDGFHYAFAHLGTADPSDEAIKRLIGHPLEVMFERLGVTRYVQNFVLAYKQRYAQTFLDQTVLLSGAFEAVRAASEFANLGVVTTKTSKFSKILLQDPKPSAEPILKALENLGICGATASKSSNTISSKACYATANKNTSAAGRNTILSEISVPDLKSLPALDPNPSKVYEQNLSSIASQNSDAISFRNLSKAKSNRHEAGDKSQKSGIGIEGESDKGGARGGKIYDAHELNSTPCYDKICSDEILPSVSQNIFMIGDTLLDAIAAKSAAVRSVGVSCGYGSASELRAHFEFVCADAKGAVELIREISSKF